MGTKRSSDVRFYYGGYDPGLSTVSILMGLETEALDPTAMGDLGERATAGERKDVVTYSGLFDDSSDDLDAAQAALLGSGTAVASIILGQATGNVAYAGTAFLLAAKPLASRGELVKLEATFKPDQAWDRCAVLQSRNTIASAYQGGSVDGGAASTAGGVWYVHCFTPTPVGTAILMLSHSTDSTTWVTKDTLAGISGRGSWRRAQTGTINRYVRLESTAGTVINVASVFSRT